MAELLPIAGWTAAAAAALVALDRLALWMERRGWIYWRRRRGRGSGVGNALLDVHALLEPDRRAMVDAIRSEDEEVEKDGAGGPKDPGRPEPGGRR